MESGKKSYKEKYVMNPSHGQQVPLQATFWQVLKFSGQPGVT